MPEDARPSAEPRDRSSIAWNRWDELVPPIDAVWVPNRSVSVCIPARDPGIQLTRTLAALSVQTYPNDLIEVIVVDDTSTRPILRSDFDVPFELRVVRQDAAGFAAGRARDLAARSANGDVLVFLDADVIPARSVLDTYLRWFETCDAVVPYGFLRFVDLSKMSTDELVDALRSDDTERLDAGHGVDDQSWREPTFRATDDLRRESADMFRTVVGATLAVSADQYRESGGFRDLGVRGVEDIEFGYRLQTNGAILIPDRSARHWHQGERTMSGERIERIRRERQPYINALLPVGGFRSIPPPTDAPVEIVPRLLVHLCDDPVTEQTLRRAREIEEMDGSDVVVGVGLPSDAKEVAFARLTVRSSVEWHTGTARAMVEELIRRRVGSLLIVSVDEQLVGEVVLTRAIRSVRRQDAEGRTIARMLFGVAVVDASRVGLGRDSARAPGLRSQLMENIVHVRSQLRSAWTKRRRRPDQNK